MSTFTCLAPFLVTALATCSLAQLPFDSPTTMAVGIQPRCIRSGDFDGDGDLDLVVCNENGPTVQVFMNDGTGAFSLAATHGGALAPVFVVVGRLDADLDLDFAVTFRDSNGVAVFLNNGSGTFVPQSFILVGARPVSIVAADFDLDGDLDLATADELTIGASVLLNDGNAGFAVSGPFPTGVFPVSIATADFTQDGIPDLAVSHVFDVNVTVLAGDGLGSFTLHAVIPVNTHAFGVTALLLNGDGAGDLVVADLNAGVVRVMLGDGVGGFLPQVAVPTGSGPFSVTPGDIDADGDLDVLVGNVLDTTLTLLINSAGVLSPVTLADQGNGPTSAIAFDVDGDSDIDVASVAYFSNAASVTFRTLFGVLGRGNLGLGSGGPFDVLDINGDHGDRDRRVSVGLGAPFVFGLGRPPTSVAAAQFLVFGQVGIAAFPADLTPLPFGIGTLVLRCALLLPADPFLVTLASSYGLAGPPAILPANPTPWSSIPLALPFPVSATFQAVVVESTGAVSLSNAVVLDVL